MNDLDIFRSLRERLELRQREVEDTQTFYEIHNAFVRLARLAEILLNEADFDEFQRGG